MSLNDVYDDASMRCELSEHASRSYGEVRSREFCQEVEVGTAGEGSRGVALETHLIWHTWQYGCIPPTPCSSVVPPRCCRWKRGKSAHQSGQDSVSRRQTYLEHRAASGWRPSVLDNAQCNGPVIARNRSWRITYRRSVCSPVSWRPQLPMRGRGQAFRASRANRWSYPRLPC